MEITYKFLLNPLLPFHNQRVTFTKILNTHLEKIVNRKPLKNTR